MDCNGVQQHAGDAIDRFLPKDVEHEFQAHLERCPPCRKEIEREKLSKQLVQQHIGWIPTPRSIYTFILSSLNQEYRNVRRVDDSPIARILSFRILAPALVGGIVAASFFLMVNVPGDASASLTAHTAENDIIHQSFDSFALVKAGQLVPAMVSSVPESVRSFFQRSSLQFGVHIPKIQGCDWCGGSETEFGGVKQAHVIYRIGNEWVYICETSDRDALYGAPLTLPPAAKIALSKSEWYTDPTHPNCNVVVWKNGGVVCVAVSTMKKGNLLAVLAPPANLTQ